MSAKFHPVDGLDQIVARMIADNVQAFVDATEAEAKRQAPPTKKWVTSRDAYVRRTHVAMDGVELPDNLRFQVQAYEWDIKHPGAMPVERNMKGGHQARDAPIAPGQFSYMREPRDHTPGHLVQIVSCRCRLQVDPEGVAKLVKQERVTVTGTKVKGTVYAAGEHVIAAEYGDEYPGGFISPGTWFMHRTVTAMGNRA